MQHFLISSLLLVSFCSGYAQTTTQDPQQPGDVKEEIWTKNAKPIEKAFKKQQTLVGKFTEQLDQMNLSYSLKQSLKLFKGASLNVRYRSRSRPSFLDGRYTRLDSYIATLPIHPGKWIFPDKSPFSISIAPGAEINFWQDYDNVSDARDPRNMYLPWKAPLSAEKALQLKPGDLVHIRAQLSLGFGLHRSVPLWWHIELRGSTGYGLQGTFDIFIYRSNNGKIRLRMIGRNNDGYRTKASLGLAKNNMVPIPFLREGLHLFNIKLLDNNNLINWFDADEIFAGQTSVVDEDIYVGDYIMDLSYPEVRDAYDDLFARAYKFRKFKAEKSPLIQLTNPFSSREELSEELVSNLTKLNEIFREDLMNGIAPSQRRIDRNFLGSNGSEDTAISEAKMGIKYIYVHNNNITRRDNKMALKTMNIDGQEDVKYYFFPVWSQRTESKGLFSYFESETLRSADMIYLTDKNFVPTKFKSIGFYYDYTDKHYRNKEHKNILTHFKRVLPRDVYQRLKQFLKDKGYLRLSEKLRNVRVSARYFINEKGLLFIEEQLAEEKMNPAQIIEYIKSVIIKHLASIPRPERKAIRPADDDFDYSKPPEPPKCGAEEIYKSYPRHISFFCEEVNDISIHLAIAIDKNVNPQLRHSHMDALIDNPLFRQIGPGIIFRMISEREPDPSKFSFVDMKFYFPDERLNFTYPEDGSQSERDLYRLILNIQRYMDDLAPDRAEEILTISTSAKPSTSTKPLQNPNAAPPH